MRIGKIRNAQCNQTIHVMIRMKRSEAQMLAKFMAVSTPPWYKGTDTCFPYHVRLVHQGSGWYKMLCMDENNGVRAIEFALGRPLKEFEVYQDEARLYELRRLMAHVIPVQTVAHTADAGAKTLQFPIKTTAPTKPKVAVDTSRIHALSMKLSNRPAVIS